MGYVMLFGAAAMGWKYNAFGLRHILGILIIAALMTAIGALSAASVTAVGFIFAWAIQCAILVASYACGLWAKRIHSRDTNA